MLLALGPLLKLVPEESKFGSELCCCYKKNKAKQTKTLKLQHAY